MQKEMIEHKLYVEKMTNNREMPFMAPVKALIDEQITTMYTFMNEIKSENKSQMSRNAEIEATISALEGRIRAVQSEKQRDQEHKETQRKGLSPLKQLKQMKENYLRQQRSQLADRHSHRHLSALSSRSGGTASLPRSP